MYGKGLIFRVLKQQIVLFITSNNVTPSKKGVGMWGLGEVSGDKGELVMRESHDFQTNMNRIKDLAGSFSRISLKDREEY